MSPSKRAKTAQAIVYFVLLVLTSSPVWGVRHYVNHDGSGHIYISYVMGELLQGNDLFSRLFELNSLAVPNSTGHWVMTALLYFLPPFLVTKITVTLTLGLFVAATLWLRNRASSDADPVTPVLFGFAIGLNWLWMQGSYNFILAAAATVFTSGLFYRWRERPTAWNIVVMALLISIVFMSHLVSFAILIGSLFVLALSVAGRGKKRAVVSVLLALLPSVPLIILYRSISAAGEPLWPFWRSLSDPTSLSSWLVQLMAGDPFVLISRKALPFYSGTSTAFSIFSPFLWITAAAVLMIIATVIAARKRELSLGPSLPFAVLAAAAFAAALVGPDDFGLTNGSILRERMMIFGMCFLMPIFSVSFSSWLTWGARAMLLFVVLFQTAALWEYAKSADAEAREFISARAAIPEKASIASVVVVADPPRFHSMPSTQLNNYVGIGRDLVVWDNYELGHYMFPVVLRDPRDKEFVFEFTTSNVFYLNNPREDFELTLPKLQSSLAHGHQRIDYMLVFGDEGRLWPVLRQWFEAAPIFENGRVRVFKHRTE